MGHAQESAFREIKECLIPPLVLALYYVNRKTKISSDASKYGIGGVVLQEQDDGFWKPIAYFSRKLTNVELHYSPIEKEALGFTSLCKCASDYILGKPIIGVTDHKPLLPMLMKHCLDQLPPRIQRFRMRLLRFNIVKNSTSLLSSLDQLDVRTATSVQTYDFSTLYTSIPHNLLKSRITALIHNSFKRRNGSNRYTHIKITSGKGYFIDTVNPGGDNLYTADQICRMVEFLIDNIFVKFGGCLFRQVIGIPMGTNCAPLLADLFLYSYESEFLDNMIRGGHRKLARSFNLCYRYIDDLIVFNNKKFGDYVKEIYPSQLTVEKANTSDDLANYLDLTFIIESNNRLYTKLYDKRDDFDFHIVNFPFLSSNIPSRPSYGVYISQLIRYARCCSYYDDFGYRHKLLVDRLLSQGYEVKRLRNSFKKFHGRYPDLIGKY